MPRDRGIRVQTRTVKSWDLLGTDQGTVALIFGMDMKLPNGRIETVGDSPLILSINQCRLLAANLAEMIDRMSGDVGRA